VRQRVLHSVGRQVTARRSTMRMAREAHQSSHAGILPIAQLGWRVFNICVDCAVHHARGVRLYRRQHTPVRVLGEREVFR
jgi:hypothetical protein